MEENPEITGKVYKELLDNLVERIYFDMDGEIISWNFSAKLQNRKGRELYEGFL